MTKSCPWYKAAARGWFQTSSSSRCSRRKRSGKRCCIQFPLCCVGRALTALSRRSGRLIPATLLPMGGGLCPWERKDNAAVPPGVTGSASRPACPRTAALSSGRVPPPEQTPPRFIWGAAFWALTPQIPGEVWEIISLCLSELSNPCFSSAHHRLPSVPLQITQTEAEDQNLHIQAVTWGQDNPFPRAGRVQGPFFSIYFIY